MERLLALGASWPGAIAVSGGGDSIALMHLLARWAKRTGRTPPVVLTVDHRLRARSGSDARRTAQWAREEGLKTAILVRKGPKPAADVEAAARAARYSLLANWLARNGIASLFLGHTKEDQAETFLLRLARGSGLDGLSAMAPIAAFPLADRANLQLVRPLLKVSRATLRLHLARLGKCWLEDPMNEDASLSRVRVRKARPALDALGLSTQRLAEAADHLSRARESLEIVTNAVLTRAVRPCAEGVLVDELSLAAAPREVGLRALAAVLSAVSGQSYRPRFARLERLFDRIVTGRIGRGMTLHGCLIAPAKGSSAAFGPRTLLVTQENRKKAAKVGNAV
jgi:tRNA(Ile)-lysidine synthase